MFCAPSADMELMDDLDAPIAHSRGAKAKTGALRGFVWPYIGMLLCAFAAIVLANYAWQHAVGFNDAYQHMDYRAGLRLPIHLVEYTPNGWAVALGLWLSVGCFAGLGVVAARRLNGARASQILLVSLTVLALALSFCPIMLSGDLYAYLIYGHVYGLYGINPYVILTPLTPHDDIALASSLGFWGNPPPSDNYGPLWTLITGGLSRMQAGISFWLQAWSYRLLGVLSLVIACAGLLRCRQKVQRGDRTRDVALFAFHPLVLYEAAVESHNDLLMVALAIWGFALSDSAPLIAGVLLGASMAVKFVSIIALPFLVTRVIRKDGALSGILCGLVALTVFAICFKPFWIGPPTLYSLINQGRFLAMSPAWLAVEPFLRLHLQNTPALPWALPLVGHPSWPRIIEFLFITGFLVVLVGSIIRFSRDGKWSGLWLAITAFLWASPVIQPWYLVWLAPAITTRERFWSAYAWWFGVLIFLRYALGLEMPAQSAKTTLLKTIEFMAMTLIFLAVPILIASRPARFTARAREHV